MLLALYLPKFKNSSNCIDSIIFIILNFNNRLYAWLPQDQVYKTTQIPLFIIKVVLQENLYTVKIIRLWPLGQKNTKSAWTTPLQKAQKIIKQSSIFELLITKTDYES